MAIYGNDQSIIRTVLSFGLTSWNIKQTLSRLAIFNCCVWLDVFFHDHACGASSYAFVQPEHIHPRFWSTLADVCFAMWAIISQTDSRTGNYRRAACLKQDAAHEPECSHVC